MLDHMINRWMCTKLKEVGKGDGGIIVNGQSEAALAKKLALE